MSTNTTDQTPAQRKAAAREALDADLNLLPDCDCGAEAMRLIDAYARACIAEAVAPALPLFRLLAVMDMARGGAGGQAFTSRPCQACGADRVAGSTSSGGLLCEECRATLRHLLTEGRE